MQDIRTVYDSIIFNKWVATTADDDGLYLSFGDTELEAYEECFAKIVFDEEYND